MVKKLARPPDSNIAQGHWLVSIARWFVLCAQTSEKVPELQVPRREDGGLTPDFAASRTNVGANFRWTRTLGFVSSEN